MTTGNKKRILHVDDDEDTLTVVKTILEKEGYDVVSVNRGHNALKEAKMNGFDLLIFDIMMPDMSGWELFSLVGKIKPNYKIIFLSILSINEDKLKQLKEAGIKDFIQKPFDRDDLVKRIKKVLDTKY